MTNKLQNKFAVGDKVVRTVSYCGSNDGFMKVGGKYVVASVCASSEYISLVGSRVTFAADAFEYDKTAFKSMKFLVNTPEQSREIQEALFSMGYKWASGAKNVIHTDFVGYIKTNVSGSFVCIDIATRMTTPEYKIKTTKSYELVPVVTEKPLKEELVELMGQKYSKKELEDALRSLKPVV